MTDMTVTEWLRDRLLESVRPECAKGLKAAARSTIEELLDEHGSVAFLVLMMNRLVLGYFRYGPRHVPGRKPTQNVQEIRRRIALYEKTGNQEHLVDVANFCLVEFVKPCREDAHLSNADDSRHAEYVS